MDVLAVNLRKVDMIARIREFDLREAEPTLRREEMRLQEAEAGDVPVPVLPAFIERPGNKMVPQLVARDIMKNKEWYEEGNPTTTVASTQDVGAWWRMYKCISMGAWGYVSFWLKVDTEILWPPTRIIDVRI